MGHMKNLLITIHGGGDEAVEAAKVIAGLSDFTFEDDEPRWIASAERSPPDRTLVMAYAAGRHVFGYTQGGDWIDTLYGWTLASQPSHWMPLPEPPAG